MRKEIVIAIFVGVLFGLVVTYGVYTANMALRNHNTNARQISSNLIPSPTPASQAPITLSLSAPMDGIVVTDPTVAIQGTTTPQAIIAIVTEDTELLVEADRNGLFSQTVTLIRGANTIQITASDTNQLSTTKTLHLVYTTDLEAESQ